MMEEPNQRNNQIKEYIEELFVEEDDILKYVRAHSKEKGLPDIHIPLHLAKLISFLAELQNCSRILEIGTLGAYSTIWLARTLKHNGKLITLEMDRKNAKIAQEHVIKANLSDKVEIRVENALSALPKMIQNKEEKFDLIFIDADKENRKEYLDYCIQLSRPGTLILVDNLIPRGPTINHEPNNHEAKFIYSFNHYLAHHPLLDSIIIPSIVQKQGRLDGIGMVRVR